MLYSVTVYRADIKKNTVYYLAPLEAFKSFKENPNYLAIHDELGGLWGYRLKPDSQPIMLNNPEYDLDARIKIKNGGSCA